MMTNKKNEKKLDNIKNIRIFAANKYIDSY